MQKATVEKGKQRGTWHIYFFFWNVLLKFQRGIFMPLQLQQQRRANQGRQTEKKNQNENENQQQQQRQQQELLRIS